MNSFAPMYRKAKEEGIESAKEEWLNHYLFEPAINNQKCADKFREIVGRYSGWNFNDVNDDLIIRLSPVPETRLHEIRVPTLIVVGQRDVPDCLEHADMLEEKIPGSEKVILKGVGHMSNMEDPAGFNKVVLGFISRKIENA